jgi:2-amino-4-hydroxy-6-hydroxymethyldihydropteridine diphosphokinase
VSLARVGLALGANLGRPRHQLLTALVELSRRLGALAVAPLFRSPPASPLPQPDFLNSAVIAYTALTPHELLGFAKELEQRAGRLPGPRHGPRALDVDLLFYGGERIAEPSLEIPHPRLRERPFVLAPLAALDPGLRLPPDGRAVGELLAALPTPLAVRQVSWLRDEGP